MKFRYYEVKTANTTYHVRHTIVTRWDGTESHGWTAFGGNRVIDLSCKPQAGFPMMGEDSGGRIRTSPVASVRRVSLKAFADAGS